MALDKPGLATALKAAFAAGLSDPDWTSDQAADALAAAIDLYVRGADVSGITTTVTPAGGGPVIGQGAQNGPGVLT